MWPLTVPLAIRRPSGLMAAAMTFESWPDNRASNRPSATFQTSSSLELHDVISLPPSGVNSTIASPHSCVGVLVTVQHSRPPTVS